MDIWIKDMSDIEFRGKKFIDGDYLHLDVASEDVDCGSLPSFQNKSIVPIGDYKVEATSNLCGLFFSLRFGEHFYTIERSKFSLPLKKYPCNHLFRRVFNENGFGDLVKCERCGITHEY